jgi:hypothetical protein
MAMERSLSRDLLAWRGSARRKPLILLGTRQVGKTWLLKDFGERHFKRLAYFNFEREPNLDGLFGGELDPGRIVGLLSAASGVKIDGETLLAFDEIQESNRALVSLKYFAESAPQLPIVAAGSLLGITLSKPGTFPVGKVDFLRLGPMSFEEFVIGIGKKALLAPLRSQAPEEPVPGLFHDRLLELLKYYLIVGGMPEAVAAYADGADLASVRLIQEGLLKAYAFDFAKHAEASDIPKLHSIWESIPTWLSRENKRFKASDLGTSARMREYERALGWLVGAGLVRKVHRVGTPRLPLSAAWDASSFKLYALDVGLVGALARLSPSIITKGDELFIEFKGAMTESYVLQELSAAGFETPAYWESGGRAEVDFLVEFDGRIIPLEVKSGAAVRSRSLAVYDERYKPELMLRVSPLNGKSKGRLLNVPLYAIGRFAELTARAR